MSSESDFATHEAGRMHVEGTRIAEQVDPVIRGILTDLANAKHLELREPVVGVIHRDRPSSDRSYAVWQLVRDRGSFLAKVELRSDDAYAHLWLKASVQSRFWESEAQRLGEALCKATGLNVYVERTQTDGIVTFSASMTPDNLTS